MVAWKRTLVSLAQVAIVLHVASCSNSESQKISPPFVPIIGSHEQFYFANEPSGMTGHRHLFALWDLNDSKEEIQFRTSESEARDNLYWLKGPSEKLTNDLKFFEGYLEYSDISAEVDEMLQDSDVRYAYSELHSVSGRLAVEGIWVCSPKLLRLAYLYAY